MAVSPRMIGVLSTVPGTVTWRRSSLATEIPADRFVALGRSGVRPNIGQSLSALARAAVAVADAVGLGLAVGVVVATGRLWPPHAARVSIAPAASAAAHRMPSTVA